jgi:hypothetical protein
MEALQLFKRDMASFGHAYKELADRGDRPTVAKNVAGAGLDELVCAWGWPL